MPEYAIGTPCSGGWMANLDRPRSGCTGGSGAGRYCCSDAVARSLPGGRSLPAAGGSSGEATPAPGGTDWIEGSYSDYDMPGTGYQPPGSNQPGGKVPGGGAGGGFGADPGAGSGLDEAAQQGANDAIRDSAPPGSWASRNWPWLVGGGVLVTGLLVVGGVLAFGGDDA